MSRIKARAKLLSAMKQAVALFSQARPGIIVVEMLYNDCGQYPSISNQCGLHQPLSMVLSRYNKNAMIRFCVAKDVLGISHRQFRITWLIWAGDLDLMRKTECASKADFGAFDALGSRTNTTGSSVQHVCAVYVFIRQIFKPINHLKMKHYYYPVAY